MVLPRTSVDRMTLTVETRVHSESQFRILLLIRFSAVLSVILRQFDHFDCIHRLTSKNVPSNAIHLWL